MLQHPPAKMINKDRWTTASICSTLVGFSLSDPSLQNSTPRCPEKCGPPLTLFSLWPLIIKPLKWVTLMGMSLSHTSILDPYPLFVSVSWLLACRKCNRFWCMQHATALNKNIRVLREKETFPQNSQQLADLLADQQLSTSPFPVATIPIFHRTL